MHATPWSRLTTFGSRRATRVAALIGVAALGATFLAPSPAIAVPTVHEITANWAGSPAPTDAPYGVTRTAEFRVNTNDAADPYANGEATNVQVTLTATNGVFVSIPAVCETSEVVPASQITANGAQLLCNLGAVVEGTSAVIQAPVKANGPVGSALSVAGTVTSDAAVAPAGPAATPPLPIVGSHGMDLIISAPSQYFQGVVSPSRFGGDRLTVVVDYGVSLSASSIPGPSSYSFDLDLGVTVSGQLPGLEWEGCGASRQHVRGGRHPIQRPGVPGANEQPDLLDHRQRDALHRDGERAGLLAAERADDRQPRHRDPLEHELRRRRQADLQLHRAGHGEHRRYLHRHAHAVHLRRRCRPARDRCLQRRQQHDDRAAGHILEPVGALRAGERARPLGCGAVGGAGNGRELRLPRAGRGNVHRSWPVESAGASAAVAGRQRCVVDVHGTGRRRPRGVVLDAVQPGRLRLSLRRLPGNQRRRGQQHGLGPHLVPHRCHRQQDRDLRRASRRAGQSLGPRPPVSASCPSQTEYISPVYSDDACLVLLPAGVTAVKMTWDPAVDTQQHHFLRSWGYVPSTALIGSESWTTGAFNAPYDVAQVFPGYPSLNNWTNISTNPTVYATIPGSTYGPNTNGTRDAMRIQGPTGVITKTTPATTAQPGVPVTFNLTAESDLTVTSPPAQTFTVIDTLPSGMTYVAGSASPEPVLSTSGAQQVLTFSFVGVPANTPQPITYQAQTAPDSAIAPGTALTNTAVIEVPGDNRPVTVRQASAAVTVPSNAATTLDKSAADNVLSYYGDASSWVLTINSQDAQASAFTDTIDVLPYNGDGRGTTITGAYSIGAVTAPAGSTVYYTTVAPASISLDPRDSSNGAPGSIAGNTVGWTTTQPAAPTAIRVVGPALAPGAAQTITIGYSTPAGTDCTAPIATENQPGQILVNSAGSVAQHTALVMLSSDSAVIGDCYALDLKKYVLAKGGDASNTATLPNADWHDANGAADYQQYAAGDTVSYLLVATNKGSGTLTNIPVSDNLYSSCGFTIVSLAGGASASNVCTAVAAVGATINTASATVTPPDGPPLTPEDPAGVFVPDPYVVAKSSTPIGGSAAAPGSTVTYKITIAEPAGSSAPALNPSLADSLSGVLDDATYVAGSETVSTSAGAGLPAGTIAVTGTAPDLTLSWSGLARLMPGEVITIEYQVTVNDAVSGDQTLGNTVVTPPGEANCGPGSTDPACNVVVLVPSYEVSKTASPASTVEGGVVHYTVTLTNTGTIDYPATGPGAASFTDDLTGVTDDAASVTVTSGGATVSGSSLIWTGALLRGTPVTITYDATVKTVDEGDHLLANVVTPTGPGGTCAAAPATCETVTRVASFTVSKTATEASAPTVPGGTVTYVVTVTNTGEVAYDGLTPSTSAAFVDDLSAVLDDAAVELGAAVYGGTGIGSAPSPALGAASLSWSGALPIGAIATITYIATVNDPDLGDHRLLNAVVPGEGGRCDPALTCRTETLIASYTVAKEGSTGTARPGDTVEYAITVTNTGQVDYAGQLPATLTDSLAAVLDDATYNGDAVATDGADSPVADQPAYSDPVLSWSGALAVGGTVTITYSVTVNDPDMGDYSLENAVAPTGPGGTCSGLGECDWTVLVQAYVVEKTTTATDVRAGETVPYTITVTNVGKVDYGVDGPASLIDDMTQVLDDASYNDDATAETTTGPQPAAGTAAPTYSEPVLSWSGPLAVGAVVTITYTVTVNDPDVADGVLRNVVTTPPASGANCPAGSANAECRVTLPEPALHVTKSASVESAAPGQTVTYTITVSSVGAGDFTAEKPASFSDDLSGVLDDAVFNGDAAQTAGSTSYDSPILTWSGPLASGDTAVITYSVTVNDPVAGDLFLRNEVTTPPGVNGNCSAGSTDPDCRTQTPIERYHVVKTSSAGHEVRPGDRISYSLTVANTGVVRFTAAHPASLVDDMSAVLDDATYNGDATMGAQFASPELTWAGPLAIGGTVTITYSVTVKAPASGDGKLRNVVTTPAGEFGVLANCPAAAPGAECQTLATVIKPPGALASTGADARLPLLLGGLLLLAGAAVLLSVRRRPNA